MARRLAAVLAITASLLLGGCGEQEETPVQIAKPQREALQKAHEAEDALQQAAEKTQRQIEEVQK